MKKKLKIIIINCVLFFLSLFCFLSIYGETDLYQEILAINNQTMNGNCQINDGKLILDNEQCMLLSKLLDKGTYSIKISYNSDGDVNLNVYSINMLIEKITLARVLLIQVYLVQIVLKSSKLALIKRLVM